MSNAGSSSPDFDAQLAAYLLQAQPVEVILVGPSSLLANDDERFAETQVIRFDTLSDCLAVEPSLTDEALPSDEALPRQVVAVMALSDDGQVLSGLPIETALGKAVRHFPEKLIVSVDSSEWEDTAFFAFGFRKLQLEAVGPIRLFEYGLSEYKQPPDWLNARYWANPERFGQGDHPDSDSEDSDDDEEE